MKYSFPFYFFYSACNSFCLFYQYFYKVHRQARKQRSIPPSLSPATSLISRLLLLFLGLFFVMQFVSFNSHKVHAAPPAKYYDLPKVVAVQNRPYYVNKDLTFQVGLLPSDPFNTGFTTGLTYTHYFKEYLGWEIINANYNFNKETSLKQDINAIDIDLTSEGLDDRLDYMTYYAVTSLVYTPIYSKNLFFNERVIHGEINFTLGAGVTRLKESGFRPLVVLGTFFRFFSKPNHSWKFDFRNNIYFNRLTGPINAWSLNIGYSIQLGARPKNNEEL